MKNKTYKCGFNHCRITDELTEENRVVIGGRSYHPECAKVRNDMAAIRNFYCGHISGTVVMSQLNRVLNNIVYEKNVSTDFLIFALKYAADSNIKINSPCGLHYIIDNSKIKSAWELRNKRKIKEKTDGRKRAAEITDDFDFDAPGIPERAPINSGFGNILKRK